MEGDGSSFFVLVWVGVAFLLVGETQCVFFCTQLHIFPTCAMSLERAIPLYELPWLLRNVVSAEGTEPAVSTRALVHCSFVLIFPNEAFFCHWSVTCDLHIMPRSAHILPSEKDVGKGGEVQPMEELEKHAGQEWDLELMRLEKVEDDRVFFVGSVCMEVDTKFFDENASEPLENKDERQEDRSQGVYVLCSTGG